MRVGREASKHISGHDMRVGFEMVNIFQALTVSHFCEAATGV